MKNKLLLLVMMIEIAACKQAPTQADKSFDTTTSVAKTMTNDSLQNSDTSFMIIDSLSHITFNGMSLQMKGDSSVYKTVYTSWLRSYQTRKQLPVAFKFIQQGTVMMGIRGDIGDELLQAQSDMKNYIANDNYQIPFEQLNAAVKDSMQRKYTILFNKPF